MLAEIFFLRLETMLRASAAQEKQFVPLPGNTLAGLREDTPGIAEHIGQRHQHNANQ